MCRVVYRDTKRTAADTYSSLQIRCVKGILRELVYEEVAYVEEGGLGHHDPSMPIHGRGLPVMRT